MILSANFMLVFKMQTVFTWYSNTVRAVVYLSLVTYNLFSQGYSKCFFLQENSIYSETITACFSLYAWT